MTGRRHMLDVAAYEKAMKEHLSQKPSSFRKSGSYPSRDQMYDADSNRQGMRKTSKPTRAQ
jgi:hypothetical protein